MNRLTKLGYRAKLHAPPLTVGLFDELRAVSNEWLTLMHGQEHRFATGWFDDDYVRQQPVMVAYAPDGTVSAFVSILLMEQDKACMLDLMRRRCVTENGTMDFLFAALLVWAKQQGYMTFSLGLSALFGVGQQSDDAVTEQVLHYVYEQLNQFYNFKGLYAFKAKFHPHWAPRYLIYPDAGSLPSVGIALVRANCRRSVSLEFLAMNKPS